MNIYVESNFVLELALLQENYESCQNILALCQSSEAQLILPSFSLVEPYETLVRRGRDRKFLATRVDDELRQLGRSQPFKDKVQSYADLITLFTESSEQEIQRLFDVQTQLLQIAELIVLDEKTVLNARRTPASLTLPDIVVYASILQHLSSNSSSKSCFITTNKKDFGISEIENELEKLNCKILFRFQAGHDYIQNQIR